MGRGFPGRTPRKDVVVLTSPLSPIVSKMTNMKRLRRESRRLEQRRKERTTMWLVITLMILAALFGLWLASKGLHPRQLRRRVRPKTSYLFAPAQVGSNVGENRSGISQASSPVAPAMGKWPK